MPVKDPDWLPVAMYWGLENCKNRAKMELKKTHDRLKLKVVD